MTTATINKTDQNSINGKVIISFVNSLEHWENATRLINGKQLTESMTRAIHRWKFENANPSLWSVDNFLVSVGLHLDEFFRWAEGQGLDAWQYGEPEWHSRELTAADWKEINKTWRDA